MSKYIKQGDSLLKIAIVGNHLPRKCGIATFTTDLADALEEELKTFGTVSTVAMNDVPESYEYPERVKFVIRDTNQMDYFEAADFLNTSKYNVVIIQHEYGIFGGMSGSLILHLIKALSMPVIVNLHTVLENPAQEQKMIVAEMAKYVNCFTVMSMKAVEFLKTRYNINGVRIEYIPHGIPDMPFRQPGFFNEELGLEKKDIILTFGLLGPDKGIEVMIKALPEVVRRFPDVVYAVVGQTHPNIIRETDDAYRHSLIKLVNRIGMDSHVIFHNHFISNEILMHYLQTCKLYVIPYLKQQQITSGTLSFAMGAGCAVVSTPFWYAEEMLDEGRGILTAFNDPQQLARKVMSILEDTNKWNTLRLQAYQFTRRMTYRETARKLLDLAGNIRQSGKVSGAVKEEYKESYKILNELPAVKLDHLLTMSDSTGILQHAKHTIPIFSEGYCTDDNARALFFTTLYFSLYKSNKILVLIKRYLSFLLYAFNQKNGRFRNFMTYERSWMEMQGSEDSHARTVWALGSVIKYEPTRGIKNLAVNLFHDSLHVVSGFMSLRAVAFTILGLNAYLCKYTGDTNALKLRNSLTERLFILFQQNQTPDWLWPEEMLAYANAKLPHALITSGLALDNHEMFDTGIKSLEWLLNIQTAPEGHLTIIGNQGWYKRGEEKAKFDQQPIEAMNLLDACGDAFLATQDKKWIVEAEKCLAWFTDLNDLNVNVYDFETGGCQDGIGIDGVNLNQGAESTLSWLISLVRMYEITGMSGIQFLKKMQ